MALPRVRELCYSFVETPVGRILLAGDPDRGLRYLAFTWGQHMVRPDAAWRETAAPFGPVTQQLHEYFAGTRRVFDVRLDPVGTPFQLDVWAALQAVPYGQTCSYAEIAEQIGRPRAVRAVGLANGRNPIPIIVPCHRVIGKDGSLTGYGGGLHTKQTLLDLERQSVPD